MKWNRTIDKFNKWREAHLKEQHFIYILAVIVGILTGFAAVIIKNLVHILQQLLTTNFSKEYHNYLFFVLPIIGIFATVTIAKFVIKRDVGHGIPKVLSALSKEKGNIRRHNLFSSIITSTLTVGFGGSVGLEGPTVATGGAIGSNIGRLLRLSYKHKSTLIVCASSGAMAAIFKAPLAAIVFVVEVIMYDISSTSLIPVLLASASATLISYFFLGMDVIYSFEVLEKFMLTDIPYYILLGVLTGFISIYFTNVYIKISKIFSKKNWVNSLITGSVILGGLIFLFPSLFGEGYESINMGLKGKYDYLFNHAIYYEYISSPIAVILLLLLIIVFKAIATSLTFSAGGIGGIFAPSLFLGVNAGLFFSLILNYFGIQVSLANFALVGMAGMISGMIHAPLTAIFLIAELTGGHQLFMPIMITSTVSYALVRFFTNTSAYTYQLAKRGELMTHDKDKKVLMMMNVFNIIERDFVSVHPSGNLRDLVRAISNSNRNIFPVVDEYNRLHGIIKVDHVRDIMFDQSKYDEITIKDIMTLPEFVVSPNEPMENVAKLFQKSSRYTIPVVKNGKYYEGFISRARFFSYYRKMIAEISED